MEEAKKVISEMSKEQKEAALKALQDEKDEKKASGALSDQQVKLWSAALKTRSAGITGMQLGKAGPPTPSEWEAHAIALGTLSKRFAIAFHVHDGAELLDVCDRKSRPRIKEIIAMKDFTEKHKKNWNENMKNCEADIFATILASLARQHKIDYGRAQSVVELVSNLFNNHEEIEVHHQNALHKKESAPFSMFSKMADHLNHYRNLWDQLASAGEHRSVRYKIAKVLEGLDRSQGGPEHIQSTRNVLLGDASITHVKMQDQLRAVAGAHEKIATPATTVTRSVDATVAALQLRIAALESQKTGSKRRLFTDAMGDYLFLSRDWARDQSSMGASLRAWARRKYPLELLLFPEGTDLSDSNKAKGHKFAREKVCAREERVLVV